MVYGSLDNKIFIGTNLHKEIKSREIDYNDINNYLNELIW